MYFDEAIDLLVARRLRGSADRELTFERARRRRDVAGRGPALGRRPCALQTATSTTPPAGVTRALRLFLPRLTIHLSILIFWPLVLAVLGGVAPRSVAPLFAVVGAAVPLGYAIILVADFEAGAQGLQYVTDDAWIDELGIRYTLGIDGLNLWLVALTTLLFAASAVWVALRPPVRAKLFAVHFGIAEAAVLGAFVAQDLALFVSSSTSCSSRSSFLLGSGAGRIGWRRLIKMVVYTLVGSL